MDFEGIAGRKPVGGRPRLSDDKVRRIKAELIAGLSRREIARRYCISSTTVIRVEQRGAEQVARGGVGTQDTTVRLRAPDAEGLNVSAAHALSGTDPMRSRLTIAADRRDRAEVVASKRQQRLDVPVAGAVLASELHPQGQERAGEGGILHGGRISV
jgi:hypothetical protein